MSLLIDALKLLILKRKQIKDRAAQLLGQNTVTEQKKAPRMPVIIYSPKTTFTNKMIADNSYRMWVDGPARPEPKLSDKIIGVSLIRKAFKKTAKRYRGRGASM